MASDYTPQEVNQGFGAEVAINQNFNDIKTALDAALNRLTALDNAMAQDLDMGTNQILNLPDASDARDPVLFKQLNSLAVVEVVQTLVFSTVMEVDIDDVTIAKITLTDNGTLNFTGTPNDGQPFLLMVQQDSIGNRLLTLDSRVRFGTDAPTLTLSTAASKLDYILFRYNSSEDKFDVLAINRGF